MTVPPVERLTRTAVLRQAWPIIVGQALIPMVGVVDAAIIGRTSSAMALAGVALGVTTINLIFWTFGFLRMGVTGLTAQALGASDEAELRLTLLRGLTIALSLGIGLTILAPIFTPVALTMLNVPRDAEPAAQAFTIARFYGAPGALAFYVINGWLLGLGRTRIAFVCQLIFNGANIAFDLWFVAVLNLGALGAGLGTSLSEWIALVTGLGAARMIAGPKWWHLAPRLIFDRAAIRRLIAVNAHILIRTLALLTIITWFARAGARLGPTVLAANHVLMQFVAIAAFVLDGFAFTAEARVGAAVGAGSTTALRRAARLTGELSLLGALLFSTLFYLVGARLISLISTDPAIIEQARRMLPFCALVPLVGMPSWWLDGIYLGATRGRAMRNATVVAACLYLSVDMTLRPWGAAGVWIALLASYIFRASLLGIDFPKLMRSVKPGTMG